MQQIVITGLDGSGKSTILKALLEKNSTEFEILFIPHFNLQSIPSSNVIHKVASFINTLSYTSDKIKEPQLKAIALLSSMLLFHKVIELKKGIFNTIFCERHPLIDAAVYAQFYAHKMNKPCTNQLYIQTIEETFRKELLYLLKLIPKEYICENLGLIENLKQFIYTWFYRESKTSIEQLKHLFKVELPHKIFYLQAQPKVLFDRIKGRKELEAHESIEVFEVLDSLYLELFKRLHQIDIEIIDANFFENLDSFKEKILY
ncbi:MAG: thymidylate kinase [Bacteroidetes bacterium ADurb.Bin217]|nr:MAG: thymidylate kinase [Bacteroidetes bacterium ADurb.Bin217]